MPRASATPSAARRAPAASGTAADDFVARVGRRPWRRRRGGAAAGAAAGGRGSRGRGAGAAAGVAPPPRSPSRRPRAGSAHRRRCPVSSRRPGRAPRRAAHQRREQRPPPLPSAAAASGCRRRAGGRRGRRGWRAAGAVAAGRPPDAAPGSPMRASTVPTGTVSPDADEDLQQHAVVRARDLRVDLVGGHLEQRVVELDGVTDLLEPAADGALGDGLAELGHGDVVHLADAPGVETPAASAAGPSDPPIDGAAGSARTGHRRPPRRAARTAAGSRPECPCRRSARSGVPTGTRLPRRHEDLQDHPVVRAGDLRVDLVGRHLEQRVVELDLVADLLEPAADHALGHRLTQLGQRHDPRLSDIQRPPVAQPCSERPENVIMVSPIASDRLGCAWMRCADVGRQRLPVHREVALVQQLARPRPDQVEAEDRPALLPRRPSPGRRCRRRSSPGRCRRTSACAPRRRGRPRAPAPRSCPPTPPRDGCRPPTAPCRSRPAPGSHREWPAPRRPLRRRRRARVRVY